MEMKSNTEIFKMMICEHLRKDEDGGTSFCTDCGLYLNDKVAMAILKITMSAVEQEIASEIRKSARESTKNYGDDCRHLRKDEDGGTPFCADCGLVFEDETVFVNECHNMNNHYSGYGQDHHYSGDDQDHHYPVYDWIHHHSRDDQGVDDHASPIAEAESEPTEQSPEEAETEPKPTEPTVTSTPTSVKDLRKIAKERGIKYYTTMSKKNLCTVLGIEISKPIKLIFKNKETGEEHGFHSIYQASKEMNINPGLVTYYLGKEMTVGDTTYTVSKV